MSQSATSNIKPFQYPQPPDVRSTQPMKNSATRTFFAVFLLLAFSSCQPAGEPVGPPVRLGEEVKNMVAESLAGIKGTVTLRLYEGGDGDTAERETRALLDFVAEASPQISLSLHSL